MKGFKVGLNCLDKTLFREQGLHQLFGLWLVNQAMLLQGRAGARTVAVWT